MRRVFSALVVAFLVLACGQVSTETSDDKKWDPSVVTTAAAPAATVQPAESNPTAPREAPPTSQTTVVPAEVDEGEITLGYKTLAAGHSFFGPVTQHFEQSAVDAGLVEHEQLLVFEGGSNGAPEALWNNEARRQEMQSVLAVGDIELLVLTYHPDYTSPDGYRMWINEALSHNPDTVIAIGIPWSRDPAELDAVSYADRWQEAFDLLERDLVDGLRAEFPDTEIRTLPYGRVAVEAYLAFESGQLGVIGQLISSTGDANDGALFSDRMGHPGHFLVEASSYLWFRLLYGDVTGATPTEVTADHERIVELALANASSRSLNAPMSAQS